MKKLLIFFISVFCIHNSYSQEFQSILFKSQLENINPAFTSLIKSNGVLGCYSLHPSEIQDNQFNIQIGANVLFNKYYTGVGIYSSNHFLRKNRKIQHNNFKISIRLPFINNYSIAIGSELINTRQTHNFETLKKTFGINTGIILHLEKIRIGFSYNYVFIDKINLGADTLTLYPSNQNLQFLLGNNLRINPNFDLNNIFTITGFESPYQLIEIQMKNEFQLKKKYTGGFIMHYSVYKFPYMIHAYAFKYNATFRLYPTFSIELIEGLTTTFAYELINNRKSSNYKSNNIEFMIRYKF